MPADQVPADQQEKREAKNSLRTTEQLQRISSKKAGRASAAYRDPREVGGERREPRQRGPPRPALPGMPALRFLGAGSRRYQR